MLWELTANELDEIIEAGRRKAAAKAAENELLAFNIGALVLAAFNAPSRFPQTPAAAFGRKTPVQDGGKASFMQIAEQLNRKFMKRSGDKQL